MPEAGGVEVAGLRLAEAAHQVGYEENHQYGAESDAGTAPGTPSTMAVIPSTEAKHQYQ